jgi:hypothetical protein
MRLQLLIRRKNVCFLITNILLILVRSYRLDDAISLIWSCKGAAKIIGLACRVPGYSDCLRTDHFGAWVDSRRSEPPEIPLRRRRWLRPSLELLVAAIARFLEGTLAKSRVCATPDLTKR